MIFIDYSIDEGFYWKIFKDEEIVWILREYKEVSRIEDIVKLLEELADGRFIRAKINLMTWTRRTGLETDLKGWKNILIELEKYTVKNKTEKWFGGCYITEDNEGNMVIKTTLWIFPKKYSEVIEIARKHIKPTVEYRLF